MYFLHINDQQITSGPGHLFISVRMRMQRLTATEQKKGIVLLGPKLMSVCGLVKFLPAVAYHFCLNIPASFSQPRTMKFSQLCNVWGR